MAGPDQPSLGAGAVTPAGVADGPDAVRIAPDAAAWWVRAAAFARSEAHWLLFAVPYLAAWWQPVLWYTGEDRWWSQLVSPIVFQPLVAVGAGLLFWQDRHRFTQRYQLLRRQHGEKSRRRHGSLLLLVLGVLGFLASQFVHIAGFAVVSLVLLLAGAILRLYGPVMLRMCARPLLFLLLMFPPPGSAVVKFEELGVKASVRLLGTLARTDVGTAVYGQATAAVTFGGATFDVARTAGGASAGLGAAALLVFVACWRRMRVLPAALLIVLGAMVSYLLNLPRLYAAIQARQSGDVRVYYGVLAVIGVAALLTAVVGLRTRNRVRVAAAVAAFGLALATHNGSAFPAENIESIPLAVFALAGVGVTLFLERRYRSAFAWIGERWDRARGLSRGANRATDKIADSAARNLGGVGRAARTSTNLVEAGFKAIEKALRRKRRRRRW